MLGVFLVWASKEGGDIKYFSYVVKYRGGDGDFPSRLCNTSRYSLCFNFSIHVYRHNLLVSSNFNKGYEQICICKIACTSLLYILYCRNHSIYVCQINVPQHYVSTISKYIIPWCINIILSLQTTKECSIKTFSFKKRIVLQDILRYHCGIKIITFDGDIIIIMLIRVLGRLPYSDVTCLSHSSPCSPCPVCYDNLSSNLIIYDGS